jgi:hypothetical protein
MKLDYVNKQTDQVSNIKFLVTVMEISFSWKHHMV